MLTGRARVGVGTRGLQPGKGLCLAAPLTNCVTFGSFVNLHLILLIERLGVKTVSTSKGWSEA